MARAGARAGFSWTGAAQRHSHGFFPRSWSRHSCAPWRSFALAHGDPPSQGCDLVASTLGSDSAPGTLTQPFRTVQKLADTLAPGQTGCLRGTAAALPVLGERHGRQQEQRAAAPKRTGSRSATSPARSRSSMAGLVIADSANRHHRLRPGARRTRCGRTRTAGAESPDRRRRREGGRLRTSPAVTTSDACSSAAPRRRSPTGRAWSASGCTTAPRECAPSTRAT